MRVSILVPVIMGLVMSGTVGLILSPPNELVEDAFGRDSSVRFDGSLTDVYRL